MAMSDLRAALLQGKIGRTDGMGLFKQAFIAGSAFFAFSQQLNRPRGMDPTIRFYA